MRCLPRFSGMAALLALVACGATPIGNFQDCFPGITAPCECPGGGIGEAVCQGNGIYGACDCSTDGGRRDGGPWYDGGPRFDGGPWYDGGRPADGGINRAPACTCPLMTFDVLPNRPFLLDALCADADGERLVFLWQVVASPAGAMVHIENPGALSTWAWVDRVSTGEQPYLFRVTATDTHGATGSCVVPVYVGPAPDGGTNHPPQCTCPAVLQHAEVFERVLLSARCVDLDNQPLVYWWQVTSNPTGGQVAIESPMTASTYVWADQPTGPTGEPYVFRATATDSRGASGSCEVPLVVSPRAQPDGGVNFPPRCRCEPQSVLIEEGQRGRLTASCLDPEGARLRYLWSVMFPIPGTNVILESPQAATTVFSIDRAGRYQLLGTATDPLGAEGSCVAEVTVVPRPVDGGPPNQPPFCGCEPHTVLVEQGQAATLSAGCRDPEGGPVSYQWSVVRAPPGAQVEIESANLPRTRAYLDRATGANDPYVFRVTAWDVAGNTGSCEVYVYVSAAPSDGGTRPDGGPTALTCTCSEPMTAEPLETVTLSGAGCVDPAGGPLRYRWYLEDSPPGAEVVILDEYSRDAFVSLMQPTTDSRPYVFRVEATNYAGNSATCLTTVHIVARYDLYVQLAWDRQGVDVDLHFLNPEGSRNPWSRSGWFNVPNDCYYLNLEPDWGIPGVPDDNPVLHVDNVHGLGPEIVRMSHPAAGTYTVAVHYFCANGRSDTWADLRIVCGGTTSAHYGPKALEHSNDFWEVATLSLPDCTLVPIDQTRSVPEGCGP